MNLLSNTALLTINAVGDPATFSLEKLLRFKTVSRIKKLLQREKKMHLGVLQGRTGVGLSTADFNAIVHELVNEGWCSLREGRQGGVLVVFNEHFNTVNVPELTEAQ